MARTNLRTYNQARLYNPTYLAARDATIYRYPAHSSTMLELLGLPPKAKLPKDGMNAVMIQGVEVWITPLDIARAKKQFHRVRCECPICGEEMSAGRLNQHICK